MRWTPYTLALLSLVAGTAALAGETKCFSPLADFSDRDPAHFLDIQAPTTAAPAKGVKKFEPVTSGKGNANIDFLYVSFSAPMGVTIPQFFKAMRLNFQKFARGTSHIFGFGPYEASTASNDPVRVTNLSKWDSDDPTGALMSFNLDSAWPAAGAVGSGRPGKGRLAIIEKAGDVQVTCASQSDFIFSTVESEAGGMHPVAGNRGFGLMASSDGQTWTFYSKAVDRDSTSLMNLLLRANPKEENLFCKGQSFWVSFFVELRNFLNERGLKVTDWNLKNHGPVPYPFQNGQQPAEQNCNADRIIIPKDGAPPLP
ncbi:hypothetical protein NK214_05605 [Chromobacterium sp. S0633]|uniref:hypothetical protein n=1 Tax=Chromobacterium sp. S0633 TaxID=2957805 RepID=UPI00209D97FA|nr:hypothetical protein [Chromobacterium sp. S0633]MCP1289662.1 hypothetical protein [Chromobacterium sp. S0633]